MLATCHSAAHAHSEALHHIQSQPHTCQPDCDVASAVLTCFCIQNGRGEGRTANERLPGIILARTGLLARPPASQPLQAGKDVTCLHGSATSMSIEGGCARTVAAGLLCRRPARRLAARWRCRAGRQVAAGAGRAAARPKRAQRARRLPTPHAHSPLHSGRPPARTMMTAPEQPDT